jgi:D-inositol-3-phosphate glycosyltransferase
VVYLPAGEEDCSKYDLLEHCDGFAERVDAWASSQELRYDVIHSHYWLSGAAAMRLRDRRGEPWVHTAHTLALVKNRQLAEGARPEPQARIKVEREIAAAADRIVASTEDEAEEWAWTYGARPERVRVVPPGVDLDTFRPRSRASAQARLGLRQEEPLVLFVGRLERLKGVEVLLRALAIANSGRTRPARLLVIGEDSRDGDESEQQRLRALASRLGLGEHVDFVGSVPQGQLPYYYAAAQVCVMPSYSESFGLVALEAQACGRPVVAADVSGLRSVVRNDVTGFLVAGHEPAGYALRLQLLLDDEELAEQMGRRGTLLAQRFTWARTADRLLDVYSELLEPAQVGVHSGSLQE